MAVGQVSFHNDKRVCHTVFVEWLIVTELCSSRLSAVRTSFLYAGGGTGPSYLTPCSAYPEARKCDRQSPKQDESRARRRPRSGADRASQTRECCQTCRRSCQGTLSHPPHPSTPDATLQKKADLELAEARKAEKAARSYDSFLNAEVDEEEEVAKPTYSSVREMEEDFM